MMGKRRFRAVFLTVTIVGGVIAAGYVSNALSKPSCQQQVGFWLADGPLGGRFFYLLDQDEDKDVRAMFASLGARYSVLSFNSDDPNTWPRLSLRTHTLIPFLVSVDYSWEREAEIGGGATKWFFCFFGAIVEVGETNGFVS